MEKKNWTFYKSAKYWVGVLFVSFLKNAEKWLGSLKPKLNAITFMGMPRSRSRLDSSNNFPDIK
jgi:hypothetical protein